MGAVVTLIERLPRANNYHIGGNQYALEIEGGISNTEPFEGGSVLVPESYNWAEVRHMGGNIYRLFKGKFGYTVNIGATAQGGLAGGEVRIHPSREGGWDVWYSVAPQSPVALSVRQVSDKAIEIYKDTATVRYSFLIGDFGYKINNRLKVGYTSDTFTHTYNVGLNGLIRQGRKLYYQGKVVARLPNPFMYDSAGRTEPVTESLNAGELTLSASGIQGMTLPVNIDPTLGPVNPSKDANILEELPNNGFGQNIVTSFRNEVNKARRGVVQFDASAIPAGSTIDSVTAEWKHISTDAGSPVGLTMYMERLTDYDWEDDGINTPSAECNWNYRKDPNIGWTGGAGGGVDATWQSTTTVPALNSWMQFTDADAIAIMQDALDNRSGLFNVRTKFATETDISGSSDSFSVGDLENATAANRPKLTVVYTISGAVFNRSRIVNMGVTGPQNRSTIANA
jgi:hypothetical protein